MRSNENLKTSTKMNQVVWISLIGILVLANVLGSQADLVANLDKDYIENKYLDQEKAPADPSPNAKTGGLKDGPVQFVIEGDTSHLFEKEDFEKREAQLLYDDTSKDDPAKLDADMEQTIRPIPSANAESSVRNASNSTAGQFKCLRSNFTTYRDNNTVQIVNGSRLTSILSNSEPTECFLVLFYVPWCPFSARLAPIYNALPRAFLNLDILAFDVSSSFGYNTKFGTSAVPMIILFQNKNVLARFNYTRKNLTNYLDFISNNTGFKYNATITIEPEDYEGPVPTVPEKRFDYFLCFSWIFLGFASISLLYRNPTIRGAVIKYLKIIFRLNPRPLSLPEGQQHLRPMIQSSSQHAHNE